MATICDVLEEIFTISEEEKENIEMELVKMFCLDALFVHADRRLWNYGVIVDEVKDSMMLAPSHDNSHVLCLQKGRKYIESSIFGLINGEKIENILVFDSYEYQNESSIKQLIN